MRKPSRGGRRSFKTILLFPPQWSPKNPHFALPRLAGALRRHGHEVLLRDLNVEFYDRILTPEYLRYSKDRALLDYEFLAQKAFLGYIQGHDSPALQRQAVRLLAIEKYFKEKSEVASALPEVIDQAKAVLREPELFYDPVRLARAWSILDEAFELISLPYYPTRLLFNDYQDPYLKFTLESFLENCQENLENLFTPFFRTILPEIAREQPDLIGISVSASTQVVPGLLLARMIRKELPGCHVDIGGNFFQRVREELSANPGFFREFAHSVIVGEGEIPLTGLVEALSHRKALKDVPGLLYLLRSKVAFTGDGPRQKLDDQAPPDLDGLPLEKYLTPEIILSIRASRGCYWNKCTFCDMFLGDRVDLLSPDRLVAEIRHLRDRYGIRRFYFIDECIPPAHKKRMAARLVEENLGVTWSANARTEKVFTLPVMQLFHDSGLRLLLWGLESGSRRIMELINKGVDLDTRLDILRNSAQAGIFNFGYIFFGFPSETREEAEKTIRMICGNTDIIHGYGRSVFTLGKQSILRDRAQEYGVADVVRNDEAFSADLSYETSKGMTREEVLRIAQSCSEVCNKAYENPLWMLLRHREYLLLYLSHHGIEYVRSYRLPETITP